MTQSVLHSLCHSTKHRFTLCAILFICINFGLDDRHIVAVRLLDPSAVRPLARPTVRPIFRSPVLLPSVSDRPTGAPSDRLAH